MPDKNFHDYDRNRFFTFFLQFGDEKLIAESSDTFFQFFGCDCNTNTACIHGGKKSVKVKESRLQQVTMMCRLTRNENRVN